MAETVVLSPETQQKFAKLADYLEQASKLARDLSKAKPFELPVPRLKRPKHVPADHEWFWSDEWQKGEREVNEFLKNGDYEVFDSMEELITDLPPPSMKFVRNCRPLKIPGTAPTRRPAPVAGTASVLAHQ